MDEVKKKPIPKDKIVLDGDYDVIEWLNSLPVMTDEEIEADD